jgi:hypothetical protein
MDSSQITSDFEVLVKQRAIKEIKKILPFNKNILPF